MLLFVLDTHACPRFLKDLLVSQARTYYLLKEKTFQVSPIENAALVVGQLDTNA